MKINNLLENEDRISMMKAAQEKMYRELADNLEYSDVNVLRGMLRRKAGKKGAVKGVSVDRIETLQSYGLVDSNGIPTGKARNFMMWLDDPNNDHRSREMKSKQFRQAADDALTRGQLKKDDIYTNPMVKRARKVIKSFDEEERDLFRKLYNRFVNDRTRNLSGNWKELNPNVVSLMKDKGILDIEGNLTEFGEFTLNYYMAFKDDPDGMDRVPRARRVGNRRRAPKTFRRNY